MNFKAPLNWVSTSSPTDYKLNLLIGKRLSCWRFPLSTNIDRNRNAILGRRKGCCLQVVLLVLNWASAGQPGFEAFPKSKINSPPRPQISHPLLLSFAHFFFVIVLFRVSFFYWVLSNTFPVGSNSSRDLWSYQFVRPLTSYLHCPYTYICFLSPTAHFLL